MHGGARWSIGGVEAVLRRRSLRSSGDFDEYWTYHEAREYQRNHLARYAGRRVPSICGRKLHLRRNPVNRRALSLASAPKEPHPNEKPRRTRSSSG